MLGFLYLTIIILTFGAVFTFSYMIFPPVVDKAVEFNERRSRALAEKMDRMYIKVRVGRLILIYPLGPPLLAALAYFLFPHDWKLLGILIGVTIGLLAP